jgi:glycosyltransferase involved in cell wall biosynthesis
MKIAEATPEIPLVVMGGGPLEQEFAQWAEGQSHVHFLGYTPHALCLSIARNAAFVLFPSIWYEGCSMVEIEVQSLGRPIIATDLGFSHEAIRDGYNGRKVPLGDVAGFVRAARECWEDPEGCRAMGENARREYVEKYQPEENYRQLESIYRELTGNRETRA